MTSFDVWAPHAHEVRLTVDGSEHVALVYGDLDDLRDGTPVLTRVHSECLTGDVFGSLRCDCGPQLQESLTRISTAGRGVPDSRLVEVSGHYQSVGGASPINARNAELRDALQARLAERGSTLPTCARWRR